MPRPEIGIKNPHENGKFFEGMKKKKKKKKEEQGKERQRMSESFKVGWKTPVLI